MCITLTYENGHHTDAKYIFTKESSEYILQNIISSHKTDTFANDLPILPIAILEIIIFTYT